MTYHIIAKDMNLVNIFADNNNIINYIFVYAHMFNIEIMIIYSNTN